MHVSEAAARFAIPEQWVLRVIDAESGGRTHLRGRPITSHAGAMGLMQVMPATWAELRAQYGLGSDPYAPRDNIIAGTAYLRAMYDRFGYPGLFAAYNAGPGRYRDHIERGRPLPRETRRYVARITGQAPAPRRSIARNYRAAGSAENDAHILPVDPIFFVQAHAFGADRQQTHAGPQGQATSAGTARERGTRRSRPVFLWRRPDADSGE